MSARSVRHLLLALTLLACGAPAPPPVASAPQPRPPPPAPPAPPAPPPRELSAPPVALTLIDGRTAQVFTIVDQLSGWYPEARPQYAEWARKEMPLDDAEQAMLAKHAKLRARRRWGALDQAFEVDLPIEEAARGAVDKKLLPSRDGEDERALLAHFAPRLEPFIASQQKEIVAFEARLASELPRIRPLIAQLGRFAEVTALHLRAVIVANPSPPQGAARLNGGILVLELPARDEALPTFLHELSHALLTQRRGTIAIAAGKCDEPVDDETLEEGLAYAFAPGLVHPPGRDLLLEMVNAEPARSLQDARARSERLGLALRTELGGALEGGQQTIGAFMPAACEAWAKVAKP